MSETTPFWGYILIGCVVLAVYLQVFSRKNEDESEFNEYVDLTKEGELWLREEMEKPFHKVIVTTKSLKLYESETFKPSFEVFEVFEYFGHNLFKSPSKRKAEGLVDISISKGCYFDKENDITIPMCEVESLQVVRVNHECTNKPEQG